MTDTTTPGYLSNAELAQQIQDLVAQIQTFKDQQTNVFETTADTATVTDAQGNAKIIPSWAAVQSAGSDSAANADLAAQSIYKVSSLTAAASQNLDDTDGTSVFEVTLNEPSTALTISNPPTSANQIKQLTLLLTQGTGSNVVTWPSTIAWSQGMAPVLSYTKGQRDMITLLYMGSGNWLGFYSGSGF